MRQILLALSLSALIPLAACGGGDGGNASGAGDEALGGGGGAAVEPVPDNATIDPQNTVVPIKPTPTPAPAAAEAMPAAFHGRWGLTANDCDPAQDYAAKGLMVVAADRLTFYESRGNPTRVEIASPTRVTAAFAMNGEGQQWTRRGTFTLLDGGRTLLTEESEPASSLRYQRCPA